MRLSAVNDVCRIPGITPKTIADWFGHDLKTAMKHHNRTTRQDLEQALLVDPFKDSEIAKKTGQKSDVKSDARPGTGTNGGAPMKKLRETGVSRSIVKQ